MNPLVLEEEFKKRHGDNLDTYLRLAFLDEVRYNSPECEAIRELLVSGIRAGALSRILSQIREISNHDHCL